MPRMKAAVLHQANTPLEVQEVNLEPPREGEIRIRIVASGVCRSDQHLLSGSTAFPVPVIPGHEGAGVVEEVGPGVTGLKKGDHVVTTWIAPCRKCYFCLRGLPAQCQTTLDPLWAGTMLDGTSRLSCDGEMVHHFTGLSTFAEFAVVSAASCVPLPKEIPLDVASLLGCAVTTGLGAVTRRARVPTGSSVVVLGAGGVGLNILQAARLVGAAPIIAIDIRDDKLEQARAFGADETINSREGGVDAIDYVHEITQGRGADFAFEATGIPAMMRQAVEVTRRGGMTVLVGIGPQGEVLELDAGAFTRSDKVLTSAFYGMTDPLRDIPLFAQLYLQGKLDLDELISQTYDLKDVNLAFRHLEEGRLARGLLRFD